MIKGVRNIAIILFIGISFLSEAQFGGKYVYPFLDIPSSARISALGGDFLAVRDDDVSLVASNPSLISSLHNNKVALSYLNYFSGINAGFFTYSRTIDKYGSFAGSIHCLNYGDFIRADKTGQRQGEFRAADYSFVLGWGRTLSSLFSIGANMKFISSDFDSYHSYGLAVDVSGTFHHEDKQFASSLIIKNIGRQLKSYTPGISEMLPFEIQLGVSKKLLHAPLRVSVLYNHLEKFDLISVENSISDNLFEESQDEPSFVSDFSNKLIRHFVFGVEFLPFKNFSLLFGFNNQKRQEMKLLTRRATVGFSWGLSIKVKKIRFTYSRTAYHLSGSPNFITMSTTISEIYKSKNKKIYDLKTIEKK